MAPADDEFLIRTPPAPEATEKKPHRWTLGLSIAALILAGVSAFYTYRQADEAHQARVDAKKASDAQAGDVERSRKAAEISALAAEKLADAAQKSANITERAEKAAERFQKISVRPRMTISLFYNDEGAGYMFGGTGIGYATLKAFEVLVDGKPQSNWSEMCRALGFATEPAFEFVVPRRETVFKSDSYGKVFWIPSGPQSEELKLKAGRIFISACYCSVFNECWKVDTHGETAGTYWSLPQARNHLHRPTTSSQVAVTCSRQLSREG